MKDTSMYQRMGMIAAADAIVLCTAGTSSGQTNPPRTPQSPGTKPSTSTPLPPPPPDYVIGADDVLRIDILGDEKMSGEFLVRPDGKIVMLQLDEITASGLKPEDLKKKIKQELTRFFQEPVPEVFVQVKAINSRKIYVQGAVNKQGPVPLTSPITFSQLVSLFGGFQEFADRQKITVISGTQKDAKGQPIIWIINYEDIEKGKNLQKYNILLHPGDTVIVRGG